jgi:hypothetical protein
MLVVVSAKECCNLPSKSCLIGTSDDKIQGIYRDWIWSQETPKQVDDRNKQFKNTGGESIIDPSNANAAARAR